MNHRRNDKTLLSTNSYTDRQRITIQVRSGQPGSTDTRHTNKLRIDRTRSQATGTLQRMQRTLETSLKISTGNDAQCGTNTYKYAVMNYYTIYDESLGCESRTMFHGRIPYNILDIKNGLKPHWKKDPNEDPNFRNK